MAIKIMCGLTGQKCSPDCVHKMIFSNFHKEALTLMPVERFGPIIIKHGPEVIKLFSCSTQLSIKFFLLINVKMPTIVGIFTFMSRKNSILGLSEPTKAEFLHILYL